MSTDQTPLIPDLIGMPLHAPDPHYVCQRRAEYPPLTEYLDGLVKGDQAQMQAYIDKCLAVKAKYPKPTQE
jgi:hypothetical protein